MEGGRTAATRERFLFAVDASIARHDSLPQDLLQADRELPAWTWLPLTPLQATIFRWSSLLNNPSHFDTFSRADDDSDEEGYPAVLPDGVKSRVRYVQTNANGALAHSSVATRIW